MSKISILGTGWLGLPLGKSLIHEGYEIKGATTSIEKLELLKKEGLSSYKVHLQEDGISGEIEDFLAESDILIINIPPGLRRNPNGNFVAKIEHLIPYIVSSSIKKVLFVSSTSVFADLEGFPKISGKTLPNASSNSGKQLIEVEHLLRNNSYFETTILRFAGLFDRRRHPATMLSKRSGIKNPKAPVNLIHCEDCIGIIKKIIDTNNWNRTFNAAYPDHPEKEKYYTEVCQQMGLPLPDYDHETVSKGKEVDSKDLMENLNYSFKKELL